MSYSTGLAGGMLLGMAMSDGSPSLLGGAKFLKVRLVQPHLGIFSGKYKGKTDSGELILNLANVKRIEDTGDGIVAFRVVIGDDLYTDESLDSINRRIQEVK